MNTKEMGEVLYGTATPIPFRVVVNEELGFKLSVKLRCNGNFTYRVADQSYSIRMFVEMWQRILSLKPLRANLRVN